jgi:phage shock protein PspC (stress-responsive transcriptional regulator)
MLFDRPRAQAGAMTTTPPEAPSGGPRVTRDDIRDLGRLRRTVGADRYLAGVSGGVARHLDIDPAIVRVLFVVLTFFGGAGLLLYGALWLLLPAEDSHDAVINLDSRSLMVALVAVLAVSALLVVGDSWGGVGFPWPLMVIGIVAAIVLLSRDRRSSTPPPGTPRPDAPPYAAPTSPATYAALPPEAAEGPPAGPPVWAPAPRPANPRKRGPILFWFTLALIALAIGVLGTVDVSGVEVAGSAYPALALGITAVMLVVGAFYGRAGGLILLGLLITPGLAVGTLAENYDSDTVTVTPLSADGVRDEYTMDAGETVVDLSQVADPEELDGRTVTVDGGLGRIEVIVPDDVDVDVTADVGGPGDVSVFGDHRDGFGPSISHRQDVSDDVADLTLDVSLGVGEIVITTTTTGTDVTR